MRTLGNLAIAAFVFCFGASALAQNKLIEVRPADSEAKTDKEFVAHAIACSIGEVKISEQAVKNAKDEEVKKFAQRMVDEHTKLRDAMLERAKEFKLGVVQGVAREKADQMERLGKLDGAAYDREYIRLMIEDHEKALKDCEKWAREAKDADLQALLRKTGPTIKEHLEHARKIADRIK